MSRPSGMCEGQPCYTTGDVEEIDVEIAAKTIEVQAAEVDLNQRQNELHELMEEREVATGTSACP